MVTIILAIALLVALTGLGVEIRIASWNIRRANVCQRGESVAERTAEWAISERRNMEKQLELLDEYLSKISWLLNFLYKRYDKFADLETEVQEGLNGVTEDTPIGEADDKYKDLCRALRIIQREIQDDEEENPESSESGNSIEGGSEKPSEPEAPDSEVPNS